MTLRVAINGFGRIGRNFMRCWLSRGAYTNIEVVGINVTSDPKTNAHLLKYDSVLGQLDGVDIQYTDDTFVINNKTIKCFSDRNPMNLPWKDWGVDLVIESTGVFNTDVGASKHLEVGAKKVILTAPGKGDGVGTYVVGVNADSYKHKDYDILSNASCTTNCLAPVVKVLDQTFGINKGLMTTIHSYTGDQRILDNSHRDLRRARAAATNIVPTSTGAAKAVALVYPEMKGKLTGIAMRVPTPNVSLAIISLTVKRGVGVDEVNECFRKAAFSSNLRETIDYSNSIDAVSSDYYSNEFALVYDSQATISNFNNVTIYCWYDNEYGYSRQVVRLLKKVLDVNLVRYPKQ